MRPTASSHGGTPHALRRAPLYAGYLDGYTHWSYTDLDLVAGDLSAFFSREELTDFDVITFTYGDVVTHGRLYLRGQFAMHRISSATSRLWLGCDFLGPPSLEGGGLFHELQLKAVLYERANKRGEPFRPHFNSAEGCYSHVVTSNAALRVKYANKVSFAYWRHHLVDSGSNCTVRRYTTNGLRWERNAASWLGESLSLSQPPPRTHADDCRLHLCAGGVFVAAGQVEKSVRRGGERRGRSPRRTAHVCRTRGRWHRGWHGWTAA